MSSVRRALLTGATGFVGSALVRCLTSAGIELLCLVRSSSRSLERLRGTEGVAVLPVHSFELPELRRALSGVRADVFFHLAAYGVNPADQDPEAMLDGNVGVVTNLLLALQDSSISRFIHAASCFEYGHIPPGTLAAEELPLRPTSLYAAAKAASVLFGSALAAKLGIPFVALRLFGVYGRGEGPHRLLPSVIDHLRRDEAITLTGGEQVRDYINVDDAARAFLAAAVSDQIQPGGTYNVCSGTPVTVRALAEEAAEVIGKRHYLLQWGKEPYRPDESMWVVGDNRRFIKATGWTPSISLPDGVAKMINAAYSISDGGVPQ